MPFSKVFDNIKTHVNSERNFNKLLEKQGIVTSRGYPKSGIHRNIFNNPTVTKILLLKEPSYQANFINYKDNFLGKVINETFR